MIRTLPTCTAVIPGDERPSPETTVGFDQETPLSTAVGDGTMPQSYEARMPLAVTSAKFHPVDWSSSESQT